MLLGRRCALNRVDGAGGSGLAVDPRDAPGTGIDTPQLMGRIINPRVNDWRTLRFGVTNYSLLSPKIGP